MMKRLAAALALSAVSAPVMAEPLTVHAGETWLFTIERGDPGHARKAEATSEAARGEVKVSVRSLFGTMMTLSNNSPTGYTFEAELIGPEGKAVTARTCTLPPGNQPTLENWPQKAMAVRIGKFTLASGGRC